MYHLAQVNVGRLTHELGHPAVHGFESRLDEINQLAERSGGFVWRYQDESGAATDTRLFDDPLIIFNMSVWESIDHLRAFVYRTTHRELLAGKKNWFHRSEQANMALWWLPVGVLPEVADGVAALERIRRDGPTPAAFNFAKRFDAPCEQAASC